MNISLYYCVCCRKFASINNGRDYNAELGFIVDWQHHSHNNESHIYVAWWIWWDWVTQNFLLSKRGHVIGQIEMDCIVTWSFWWSLFASSKMQYRIASYLTMRLWEMRIKAYLSWSSLKKNENSFRYWKYFHQHFPTKLFNETFCIEKSSEHQ